MNKVTLLSITDYCSLLSHTINHIKKHTAANTYTVIKKQLLRHFYLYLTFFVPVYCMFLLYFFSFVSVLYVCNIFYRLYLYVFPTIYIVVYWCVKREVSLSKNEQFRSDYLAPDLLLLNADRASRHALCRSGNHGILYVVRSITI